MELKQTVMKKNIFTLLFSLLFIIQANAYTQRNLLQNFATLQKVESALVLNQEWVPYPDYNDRNGWDDLLGNDIKAKLITEGEKALNYEWKVVKLTDYLEYERSGSREIMQVPFNQNITAITNLLLAELAEGKGRFTDQLMNGVFAACEMTTWSLSAHLTLQNSKRTIPDHNEHIIDLTAGDLGSLLSWTYYFFNKEFDKVNPIISERLRDELQERILNTYMNEDRFWWMAFNLQPGGMVNNWNPWCNFNVLQSFLLLENDREKLAKAVYRTMRSVDEFINYTHEDGACEEGPSYWGHAAGKMYDYLQILSDGTKGEISIFNHPMIKNMGEYIVRSYVGDGWVVNFADASARGGGDPALIYRYGKAVESDMMIKHAAYLNDKEIRISRDIFRTLQNIHHFNELNNIEREQQKPLYSWYPNTEFCYMTNKEGFFLATKGGYNNESHNHNDLGTFSLYLNNTPIFIDAGVGTYTRQTFSGERYSIWTMQSDYHNLPLINGVSQAYGSQYKAKNTAFNSKKMHFSTDIADAYPVEAGVKQWVRSYSLSNKKLLIKDDFSLEEATQANEINFLTWGDIDFSENGKVKIVVNDQKVLLSYNKNDFEVSIKTILLDDPRLSNVWGSKIYRLTLTAKNINKRDTYNYTVQQIN